MKGEVPTGRYGVGAYPRRAWARERKDVVRFLESSVFIRGFQNQAVSFSPPYLPGGNRPVMKCMFCGYDDDGLNPFSKCLQCGQPLFDPSESEDDRSDKDHVRGIGPFRS